ncbi:hypothetical protein KKF61_03210 [Patescibacteria group bacterium]|nr:hypothetical protein [Patescibacteria group bacterium]MBU0964247.1 hypothetical protein [Patescibacteria group bacterium]
MPIKHLIWSSDFTKEEYDRIFETAENFVSNGIPPDLLKGKIMATLFFQPSTRTMSSAQAAMIRAGGGWIGVSGTEGLSLSKGEDLADTIRTYGDYSDIISMRHPDDEAADIAGQASVVPFINCGSGSKEHAIAGPFLLFNAYHYLKGLEGKTLGIYGTPGINRCVKAMLPLMGYYKIKLYVDDLGHFPIPKEVEQNAKDKGLAQLKYAKLDDFIGEVDELIVTRGLQKGIIEDFPKEQEEEIMKRFEPISLAHMKKLRSDAFLEMITPRIFEIKKECDDDPRTIFTKKGFHIELYLAVITHLLGVKV